MPRPHCWLGLCCKCACVDLPALSRCHAPFDDRAIFIKPRLALERLGHERHSLYDGSWAEWGMYGDLKVATG